MSDFLENLISRSLNRLEVVQPRLASIFEPHPFTPPAQPPQDFSDEQTYISTDAEEVGPTAPPPARVSAAHTPSPLSVTPPANEGKTGETVAQQEIASPLKPEPEKPSRHGSKRRSPSLPAGIDDVPSVAEPPSVIRTEPQHPHPSTPAQLKGRESPPVALPAIKAETRQSSASHAAQSPVLPVTDAERPTLQNELPRRVPLVSAPITQRQLEQLAAPIKSSSPGPPKRESQSSPRAQNPDAVRHPVIPPALAKAVPVARATAQRQEQFVHQPLEPSPPLPAPAVASPGPITVQPVVRREPLPAVLKSEEPDSAADKTPTIQVTIGRIEVRAAPESKPRASVQGPAPSLMSLSDYLRQRNSKGGAR